MCRSGPGSCTIPCPSASGTRRRTRRAPCSRRSAECGAGAALRDPRLPCLTVDVADDIPRVTRYKLTTADGLQSFELRVGVLLVVGRSLASDIPVLDPSISRRHAEVTCDERGVHIRDLGSSNGTFLNGEKVDAASLGPNDTVSFGRVAFQLRPVTPP